MAIQRVECMVGEQSFWVEMFSNEPVGHKPGLGQTAADDIGLMAGEVGQVATRLALQLPN